MGKLYTYKKDIEKNKEKLFQLLDISTFEELDEGLECLVSKGIFNVLEDMKGNIIYEYNYNEEEVVFVDSEMLEFLLYASNGNTLKAYVFLCDFLKNNSKKVRKDFIAENIGLDIDEDSIETVSCILASLLQLGYIKVTEANEYAICSKEEWIKNQQKAVW